MFLPLRDENPTRRFPFVTYALIAANVLVFGFQMSLKVRYPEVKTLSVDQDLRLVASPGGAETVFIYAMGLVPYEWTHGESVNCGLYGENVVVPPALQAALARSGRRVDAREAEFSGAFGFGIPPNALTGLTNLFLHGSLLHLLGNLLYLWIFGDNVEDRLGHGRFLGFYLVCGLLSNAAHVVFSWTSVVPTIGASGAIAGVMGAYLYLFPQARIRCLYWFFFVVRVIPVPAFFVLGFWILLQVVQAVFHLGAGAGSGVAWMAHVGGFVAGYILARRVFRERRITAQFYR